MLLAKYFIYYTESGVKLLDGMLLNFSEDGSEWFNLKTRVSNIAIISNSVVRILNIIIFIQYLSIKRVPMQLTNYFDSTKNTDFLLSSTTKTGPWFFPTQTSDSDFSVSIFSTLISIQALQIFPLFRVRLLTETPAPRPKCMRVLFFFFKNV